MLWLLITTLNYQLSIRNPLLGVWKIQRTNRKYTPWTKYKICLLKHVISITDTLHIFILWKLSKSVLFSCIFVCVWEERNFGTLYYIHWIISLFIHTYNYGWMQKIDNGNAGMFLTFTHYQIPKSTFYIHNFDWMNEKWFAYIDVGIYHIPSKLLKNTK